MSTSRRALGYFIAIAATGLLLLLRLALFEQLAEQARLLPFVVSVMAAAWVGGRGPGLLATFLAAFLGVWFIVPPTDSLRIETLADGLNAAMFVAVGITLSFVFESLHKARKNEAEKQFHVLADSVAQLVWIAQPSGERTWFNERWYEYTGTVLGQVAGSRWQSCCDPDDLPRVQQSWNDALERGEAWEQTYRLRSRDGKLRWFLARAVPIRNRRGHITRWFGTSTDIHDRVEMERALKEADGRKDRYLATLAHELRNPLTPISNALQLWPKVAGDAKEMEELRIVMLRQVKQLVRLVDDLLDVSRISQGKIALRRKVIDLRQVVRDSLEALQPHIAAKSQQASLSLPDAPLPVNGDVARLMQVLFNIMNNAVKYTPRGGEISISAERKQDSIIVRIRDNGAGIPAALLDRIFEAFYQVDRTIDSSQGGLGVGLTLAKQLIELHGGGIMVHSDGPGRGAEFAIYLPIENAVPFEAPKAGPPACDDAEVSGRRRLLVVDDIEDCANTLAELLRRHGQDAVALYDGAVAIDWIAEHRPDAVLIDIAMPGLDGYQVARRLRARQDLHDTTLIALTGYGQPDDRRRALEGGFNHHMTKPVTWAALRAVLQMLPSPAAEAAPVG